jgi:hypothetical protein
MRYESWYEPITRAYYSCRNSPFHMFSGDSYEDSLNCPICGGLMECVNTAELQQLGLRAGDVIPSANRPDEDYVE